MKATKIDWCDCTINPVVGCARGCEYCYARKMNDRFGWVENFKEPQFFPERLKQLETKNPKSIFMNSMSDIEYWTDEQMWQVVRATNQNLQHQYIYLTKRGYSLFRLQKAMIKPYGREGFYAVSEKSYFGVTVTKQEDCIKISSITEFLSIEPILEPIVIGEAIKKCENLTAIIIGAETGSRKGKVVPKKEWIDQLVSEAEQNGIDVFMKESLRPIMGADFRQDRLPWEVKE